MLGNRAVLLGVMDTLGIARNTVLPFNGNIVQQNRDTLLAGKDSLEKIAKKLGI